MRASDITRSGRSSDATVGLRWLIENIRRGDGLHTPPSIGTDWSAETLRDLVTTELPGAEIIVISNREPYIHNWQDGELVVQTPASGLVSALEPVIRSCGGTWIAHGSGLADKSTVDDHDRVRVPPEAPTYNLRRIWISAEEQEGYYYGFANEGLWPLCHIAFVRPQFRESDWKSYVSINQRFADAVLEEAKRDDPIVLVQDYHLALVPGMVRQRLPQATIVTFWHIPWPNAESFGICPWTETILRSLLESSIMGFHTRQHCSNFLDTVDRFIECRVDRVASTVVVGGNETAVAAYPISIEWPPAQSARQRSIEATRRSVRQRFGLADDVKLAVGVERLDYTKGIPERIGAVGTLLDDHPEWRGRFAFVQAAAPSRDKLDSYRQLQREVEASVDRENRRFANNDAGPIRLVLRHHEQREVSELFRAADVCVVSSLHDGMNLVAKEFVAARDDEQGVLILSSFAGAASELGEALIVNPYDQKAMAEAMHRALLMPPTEQSERMQRMRAQVREHNVFRWAGQMLLDAVQIRRQQFLLRLSEQSDRQT